MSKRTFQLLLVAWLVTGTLWAANDPFVGKWKLNPSKSKLIDYMKVKSLGGNKYALDLGGGAIETIVADGMDQSGVNGTTLSVTVEGPVNWKVVRKKGGHTLVTGIWTLSQDGRRSAITLRLTGLTGRRLAWIMCISGRRQAQVSRAHG
ncbi:MAG: hypothetical protein ACRD3O_00575 [Terriglobia bacterium]